MARNILDIPKKPAIDISTIKVKRAPKVHTLLKYFTEDDSNTRLGFLQKVSQISKQPQWMQYLKFLQANSSGDLNTFSEENKKYIEKIIKEVDEKQMAENSGS